jgi:hypothetical protein
MGFHVHEWEVYKESPLNVQNSKGITWATGCRLVMRCKVCGKIHQKDIY